MWAWTWSRTERMAIAIKFVPAKRRLLAPEMKAFIDRAVVPALVKEFLAEEQLAVVSERSEVVETGASARAIGGVNPE